MTISIIAIKERGGKADTAAAIFILALVVYMGFCGGRLYEHYQQDDSGTCIAVADIDAMIAARLKN